MAQYPVDQKAPAATASPFERRVPPAWSIAWALLGITPLILEACSNTWLPPRFAALTLRFVVTWCGALICFLGGVRRGLSFHSEGVAERSSTLVAIAVFLVGVFCLTMPSDRAALIGATAGFAGVAVLDVLAAQARLVPAFFSYLRPIQMSIAALCAASLLAFGNV